MKLILMPLKRFYCAQMDTPLFFSGVIPANPEVSASGLLHNFFVKKLKGQAI